MSTSIPLRCRCGAVTGNAVDVSAATGNHLVCYCDDCRAFLRWLDRSDLLDPHGGTPIYQLTPAQLRIEQGSDRIRSMRLSPKGLTRFYVDCCHTPIGNTVGKAKFPFVGVPTAFLDLGAQASVNALGSCVVVHGRFATADAPASIRESSNVPGIARVLRLLLRGFVKRAYRPSCLYDLTQNRPVSTPYVLSKAERDALRAADAG